MGRIAYLAGCLFSRLGRTATAGWVLASLHGCHLFFGDPKAECATDDDCLMGTICAGGTCVTGARAVVDAAVDAAADAAVVDTAVDAALDAAVDATADAALDAGDAGPPFPGGRCFDQPSMAWVTGAADDTHVPRGVCTPWAVVWTRADAAGDVHLHLLRGPGSRDDAVRGPVVAADSPLATDGRFLVFLAPGEGGALRAQRLDLTGETAVPLSASGLPERDVARAVGVSAHVEVEPELSGVVLTFDDDTRVACRRAGRRQWGVALGAGRAAWLEAPARGGRATLVVTDGLACEPRVLHPLGGEVAPDARVAAAGGGFFWIERPRDAPRAVVAGLRPDARGRLRPLTLQGLGSPVEVQGGAAHLAVVHYQPGRYVLDLMEVSTGDVLWSSDVSARHPVLSGDWMMWAQAAAFVLWELRYVDLATLR